MIGAFQASVLSGSEFDTDAMTYISAVETADGQALEYPVKIALSEFVKGCKSDGIWDAIKACCILAGPRTLGGCLVPLKGTAPSKYSFVSGDYNRKTGLYNNGTKYLASRRYESDDPQNSQHLFVDICEIGTNGGTSGDYAFYAGGAKGGLAATTSLGRTEAKFYGRSRVGNTILFSESTGGYGVSRSASGFFVMRCAGANNTITVNSNTPEPDTEIYVFCRNNNGPGYFQNARLRFYSIGEAIDLAKLDSRVSAYVAAIGSVI